MATERLEVVNVATPEVLSAPVPIVVLPSRKVTEPVGLVVPDAGATVAVGARQETTTSGDDGRWSYYFALNQPAEIVDVTATLPNGASQTQSGIEIRRRATVLVPTFAFPI